MIQWYSYSIFTLSVFYVFRITNIVKSMAPGYQAKCHERALWMIIVICHKSMIDLQNQRSLHTNCQFHNLGGCFPWAVLLCRNSYSQFNYAYTSECICCISLKYHLISNDFEIHPSHINICSQIKLRCKKGRRVLEYDINHSWSMSPERSLAISR